MTQARFLLKWSREFFHEIGLSCSPCWTRDKIVRSNLAKLWRATYRYECFFCEIFALRQMNWTNLANRPSSNRHGDCSSYVEWNGMRPKCWNEVERRRPLARVVISWIVEGNEEKGGIHLQNTILIPYTSSSLHNWHAFGSHDFAGTCTCTCTCVGRITWLLVE